MKVVGEGQLAFGLMGSMEWVEEGSSLETVVVGGTELRHTLQQWGSALATYHGRNQVKGRDRAASHPLAVLAKHYTVLKFIFGQ